MHEINENEERKKQKQKHEYAEIEKGMLVA